jgi:hypothetical protein
LGFKFLDVRPVRLPSSILDVLEDLGSAAMAPVAKKNAGINEAGSFYSGYSTC